MSFRERAGDRLTVLTAFTGPRCGNDHAAVAVGVHDGDDGRAMPGPPDRWVAPCTQLAAFVVVPDSASVIDPRRVR